MDTRSSGPAKTDRSPSMSTSQLIPFVSNQAVYQRFVARMDRVYYLDLPAKYAALSRQFPYIPVKTLGEFFQEKDTLMRPESY